MGEEMNVDSNFFYSVKELEFLYEIPKENFHFFDVPNRNALAKKKAHSIDELAAMLEVNIR
jgi:hypothetical protein